MPSISATISERRRRRRQFVCPVSAAGTRRQDGQVGHEERLLAGAGARVCHGAPVLAGLVAVAPAPAVELVAQHWRLDAHGWHAVEADGQRAPAVPGGQRKVIVVLESRDDRQNATRTLVSLASFLHSLTLSCLISNGNRRRTTVKLISSSKSARKLDLRDN